MPHKVEVRTPSGVFTLNSGPGHTIADVADAAQRRYWPSNQRGVEVRDEAGTLIPKDTRLPPASLVLYASLPTGFGA